MLHERVESGIIVSEVRQMPGGEDEERGEDEKAMAVREIHTHANTEEKKRDFEQTALAHLDWLYDSALRMTRNNKDDAHDLVQDCMLRAYEFYDKFQKGTNIRGWLFTILTNTHLNRCKKVAREPIPVELIETALEVQRKTVKRVTARSIEQEDVLELVDDDVKHAICSLPEEFRTVVLLADLGDFSYKEIAELLKCPMGTVMSRLYRGRKLLRGMLADYASVHGYGKK
jgi:RNA polymerase sigma-70 factor (ECF subfamily)